MITNGWGKYFTTNEGTAYLDKYSSRNGLMGLYIFLTKDILQRLLISIDLLIFLKDKEF